MIAHINNNNKEQKVEEHLINVAQHAFILGNAVGMGHLAYLAGILHDLGKWRMKFEHYIRIAVSNSKQARRGEVNHSSAGAIFVYQRYYKGDENQRLTAQMVAMAILSHHGLYDCLDTHGIDHFHRRVEDLDGLDYDEVMDNLSKSQISISTLDEYFDKAVEEIKSFKAMFDKIKLHPSYTISMIERMLLSILIDADRFDTARFCDDWLIDSDKAEADAIWDILSQNLETHLNSYPNKGYIAEIRRRVSDECLQFAANKPGIYRLAVPTGGAKTLSSLRYALNHAKQYKKKHIFYMAPYLSILEQNSEVFRSALANDDYILEHHSNVVYEEAEQEAASEYNRYKLLTENWDSPIVVTTFVQFLNTMFSDSTQSVRRFHSLADSVIIIDEIQSLPVRMIAMFNLAMNYLSCMCGTTIILCSATQPVLDKVRPPIYLGEPHDIIKNKTELYRQLKRVRVEAKQELMDTETLSRFVTEIMNRYMDVLIIVNTKAAASELFSALKQYYADTEDDVLLIHLSTHMCAQHRLDEINRVRNNLKKVRIVCVSTALIEAGVDLSFSCVVRSYAGLDSIAQAAGRCNRNGEALEGIVYLIQYQVERLGHLKEIRQGAECSKKIVDSYMVQPERYQYDLLSTEALDDFYKNYYYDKQNTKVMYYKVEREGFDLIDLLTKNRIGREAADSEGKKPDLMMFQAFKTAGKHFEVIANNTTGVIVPYEDGTGIISNLSGDLPAQELKKELRAAQRYTVNLYKQNIDRLKDSGALYFIESAGVWVLRDGFYDNAVGVVYDGVIDYLEI